MPGLFPASLAAGWAASGGQWCCRNGPPGEGGTWCRGVWYLHCKVCVYQVRSAVSLTCLSITPCR